MEKDFKILEYSKEYEQKVKDFLIEVAINEFGFEDWRDYFVEAKFLNINPEKEKFWIAIDRNGEIVGTIGIMNDIRDNTAKLHSLYVKKEYRKLGIATILYDYSEKFAKEKGYKLIILHTYTVFEDAIKFYQKRGFRVDKDIRSQDGIWYSKNISKEGQPYIWKDYFGNIRNKYSMRVSTKNPLIINLDGKNTTNNIFFSLIDKTEGGFLDIMEKTVKYFSYKYNCISIFGTDEVSFIFENPMVLINDINDNSNKKSDEIISMFSQYFFEYFNSLNEKEKIFWHGECFSIPKTKVNSYIRYKMGAIKNVLTTYFLKKNTVKDAGKIKLSKKIEECKKIDFYENSLKDIQNGILYYNGDRVDIESFLNGKIKIINPLSIAKKETALDITTFDWDE